MGIFTLQVRYVQEIKKYRNTIKDQREISNDNFFNFISYFERRSNSINLNYKFFYKVQKQTIKLKIFSQFKREHEIKLN